MNAILAVQSIDADYGGRPVVQDASVELTSGAMVALIGPNGAGKSTLTKVMARIKRPAAGVVELHGRDIWKMTAWAYSRHVAYVAQTVGVAWPYTVEQIVSMGRFAHRGWLSPYTASDREAVDRALAMTGLEALRERSFHTLSGGEAQRAILARAIAQEPEVLILDEPVAHLDVKYQIEILNVVRGFIDDGIAVVICLHDLALTALYADRVVLIESGRIRANGDPEEVLNKHDLEAVYGTPVAIDRYPGTGRLRISAVPDWAVQS